MTDLSFSQRRFYAVAHDAAETRVVDQFVQQCPEDVNVGDSRASDLKRKILGNSSQFPIRRWSDVSAQAHVFFGLSSHERCISACRLGRCFQVSHSSSLFTPRPSLAAHMYSRDHKRPRGALVISLAGHAVGRFFLPGSGGLWPPVGSMPLESSMYHQFSIVEHTGRTSVTIRAGCQACTVFGSPTP